MVKAPRTFEFDHLPCGDEAAVYFAPHFFPGRIRFHDRNGILTLELRGVPIQTLCISGALCAIGVVAFGDRFGITLDGDARIQVGILATTILAIVYGLGTWLNRDVADLNPIVVYDRDRRVVRLAERAEAVSVDDVVAVVDWRITSDNYKELGFSWVLEGNRRGPPMRQIMLLTKLGERFRLEYLYHDRYDLYPQGKDPAFVLAQALGRPVGKVAKSTTVRDTRPVDLLIKRF